MMSAGQRGPAEELNFLGFARDAHSFHTALYFCASLRLLVGHPLHPACDGPMNCTYNWRQSENQEDAGTYRTVLRTRHPDLSLGASSHTPGTGSRLISMVAKAVILACGPQMSAFIHCGPLSPGDWL